jgi:hypothetical protein
MGKLSIDGKGAFDTRLTSFIGLHERERKAGWKAFLGCIWLQPHQDELHYTGLDPGWTA